jgi:hypothetical protein
VAHALFGAAPRLISATGGHRHEYLTALRHERLYAFGGAAGPRELLSGRGSAETSADGGKLKLTPRPPKQFLGYLVY